MNEKEFFITGFVVNYVSARLAVNPGFSLTTEIELATAKALDLAVKAWDEYVKQTKR